MAGTQVRLNIEQRTSFAEGITFGETGPYERLAGKAEFALDPEDPRLPGIVDLAFAPRNAEGRVEFQADVDIIKPVDVTRGNRRLFFEASNRGGRAALRMFNDASGVTGRTAMAQSPEAQSAANSPPGVGEAGNGFLMERGYSLAWCGWQGDLVSAGGNVVAYLPEARVNGEPVRGKVRQELTADRPGVLSMPVSGETRIQCYPVLDRARATLTVREHEGDPRVPVPDDQWELAKARRDPSSGEITVTPSTGDLFIKGGYRPGWLYELIYDTEGSRVMGLGMAGIRDFLSFLRYDTVDVAGTPNPLVGATEYAYAFGSSLSARTVRQFVYDGYNEDPQGRKIFDGIYSHSAGGGRLFMNIRFAQVGRYPRQHEDHSYPSERYPFAYGAVADPYVGEVDSILKRPTSDPLVMHTHSSSDYWQRHGSLGHTDPATGLDLDLPEGVRMYYLTGTLRAGGEADVSGDFIGQLEPNGTNMSPVQRACLTLLDRWVTDGTPPPPSRLPRRSDGSLAPPEDVLEEFPQIPGVNLPPGPSRLPRWNYGPDFDTKGIISNQPPTPVAGQEYPLQVPQVDPDGNEMAGLRTPDVAVPLGTYTGWNLRKPSFAEGDLLSMTGSFIPFARTRAERQVSGDPRPSVEERYGDHAGYLGAVTQAVDQLVADGLLLQMDGDRYVEAARRKNPFDPSVRLGPLLR